MPALVFVVHMTPSGRLTDYIDLCFGFQPQSAIVVVPVSVCSGQFKSIHEAECVVSTIYL